MYLCAPTMSSKRERLGDDGLERARFQAVVDEFLPFLSFFRGLRYLHNRIASEGQAILESREQGYDRILGREAAIQENRALVGGRFGEFRQRRPDDGVEDDVRARASRDIHHRFRQILLIRHDDVIGARVQEKILLGPPPRVVAMTRAPVDFAI